MVNNLKVEGLYMLSIVAKVKRFIYQNKVYFWCFFVCVLSILMLKIVIKNWFGIVKTFSFGKTKVVLFCKKMKASSISFFYKIKVRLLKIKLKVKNYFVRTKNKYLFIIFYMVYISFFIYLVVVGRMQEADVAFKYIVFPMYFALPILFKNAFDKLEGLSEKIEGQFFSRKTAGCKGGRFSNKDEIKAVTKFIDISQEEYQYSGIPLIFDGGKEAYIEDSESHSLIIGSTGCGKTRRFVLPLINVVIRSAESFIATDPKGELYSSTKKTLEEKGYKVIVLNFRNPGRGNSWNPLLLPYKYYKTGNKDKAVELLNDIGLNIIYNKNNTADPFWENSAVDYFVGLALALFEDAENEMQINFNSIYNMSRIGEERIANRRIIETYFGMKEENDLSSMSVSGTIHAPNETRASILSVFHQKIRIFYSNEGLSRMLSCNDFDIKDFSKQKTALFLIIHDEKSVYHPLASAFLKQCYEVLVDTANGMKRKRLNIRMNFILDEFANLPPIVDMDNIITASRSRNIRMYLVIQGMKQLNSAYGDNVADIIKGNCDYWYYMMSKELSLLKEISELCGTKQNDEDVIVMNSVPLISVSELQRLNIGEVLVMQKRLSPYMANLLDINEYNFFEMDSADEPSFESKKMPDIFSIRKYVTRHIFDELIRGGMVSEEEVERFKENVEEMVRLINKRIDEKEKAENRERQELEGEKKLDDKFDN